MNITAFIKELLFIREIHGEDLAVIFPNFTLAKPIYYDNLARTKEDLRKYVMIVENDVNS